jgi:dihydroorotate dehydrogenase
MRLLAAIPGAARLVSRLLSPRDRGLAVRALGLSLKTPLGVAAGVDKNATWFRALSALGFGFVEVGTVTAEPQPGNPGKRVSRLPRDRALLNAMGFPNDGAAVVAGRLRRHRSDAVGANIGKTMTVDLADAVPDYEASARLLGPGADYLAINVSSPNTPGLTEMQSGERLAALVEGVREEARRVSPDLPVLVKIGPDLSDEEIDRIADLALSLDLDGIVAGQRRGDRSRPPSRRHLGGPAEGTLTHRPRAAARKARRPDDPDLRGGDRDPRGRLAEDPRRREPSPGLHGLRLPGPPLAPPHEPRDRPPPSLLPLVDHRGSSREGEWVILARARSQSSLACSILSVSPQLLRWLGARPASAGLSDFRVGYQSSGL